VQGRLRLPAAAGRPSAAAESATAPAIVRERQYWRAAAAL
jgi:hypothetical protein